MGKIYILKEILQHIEGEYFKAKEEVLSYHLSEASAQEEKKKCLQQGIDAWELSKDYDMQHFMGLEYEEAMQNYVLNTQTLKIGYYQELKNVEYEFLIIETVEAN